MIGHDFDFFNESIMFLANFLDNLFQATIHSVYQDFATIFGTPDDMIMTVIGHMVI